MLKTQYSRIINKRTSTAGAVPVIGPSGDHTDGSWTGDTMIYPGEFFINMEDQKVWFGWTSGSTSGTTMIYPPPGPGGGLTIVGGAGISVSGASPDFSIAFNGNTTTFPDLNAGSEEITIATTNTYEAIVLAQSQFPAALYVRFMVSALDLTTYDAAVYEAFVGIFSDGVNPWAYITGAAIINGYDPASICTTPSVTYQAGTDYLIIPIPNTGPNDIKVRVYWEYSIIS